MLPAELFEDSPDSGDETGVLRWADALRAAALIAVDPVGLGGVALIAQHGPVRERWIALLRSLLPPDTPVRRVPLHVRDDRLIGGLDLSATLQSGRPVAQTGLMVEADGGLLMVTATDMAVLCGNNGEVCWTKYGAYPVHRSYCHEMAVRILLASIETHAARHKRYIVPLISLSIDFYVRVFVRVYTSGEGGGGRGGTGGCCAGGCGGFSL